MSYVVLARKYRPQTFDEIVGQSHITETLKRAVDRDRLSHAYLFCGPRGIGKTSCARILAKSLNCEKGPTLKPCGRCHSCKEIARGSSFDVIEIDGASNRGIDEVRTLRENVKFAPGYGKYKIYIVDEVHMLTPEAFNALLKTLEEPPDHVKFVFATTEPQKLPATIISRCQRFDFKRLSVNSIIQTLGPVAREEKLKVSREALLAIARAASGSMRDALSILDQAGSLSGNTVGVESVTGMLGIVETQLLFRMSGHLAAGDAAPALEALDEVIEKGKDVRQLNKDLIEHYRNLMVLGVGGAALSRLVDYPVAVKEQYLEQAGLLSTAQILKTIDLLIEAQETARITQSWRIPLEIAFMKATTAVSGQPVKKKDAPVKMSPGQCAEGEGFSPVQVLSSQKKRVDLSGASPDGQESGRSEDDDLTLGSEAEQLMAETIRLDLAQIKKSWNALTYAVSREKMSLATLLQEGCPYRLDEDRLTVSFPQTAAFHKETLEEEPNRRLVERILSERLRVPIVLQLKLAEDHAPPDNDTFIKETLETFKGKIINQWHRE